ncbi:TetR family transcriptional regulator C-terminal domain-containing protein [Streptomyces sp. NPDC046821]|uniref:TetR family transcriptional regulator C-terminal domain-containing protein n=1 Tax=Streptomyces sp. NPDC046821 TaxID=3154702 RepID=UPI0033C76113
MRGGRDPALRGDPLGTHGSRRHGAEAVPGGGGGESPLVRCSWTLRTIHNDFYARWREAVVRVVRRGQRQGRFRADADAERLALSVTALTAGPAIQVLT